MKMILTLALALTAFLNNSAQAAQYDVYVTHSISVSPSQANLASLVQKDIMIDTAAKIVNLQISANCKTDASCSEMLHTTPFKIIQASEADGALSSVKAEGILYSNGRPVPTTIYMNLNADNAMSISLINSADCKGMRSDFVGSPSKTATFFAAE